MSSATSAINSDRRNARAQPIEINARSRLPARVFGHSSSIAANISGETAALRLTGAVPSRRRADRSNGLTADLVCGSVSAVGSGSPAILWAHARAAMRRDKLLRVAGPPGPAARQCSGPPASVIRRGRCTRWRTTGRRACSQCGWTRPAPRGPAREPGEVGLQRDRRTGQHRDGERIHAAFTSRSICAPYSFCAMARSYCA